MRRIYRCTAVGSIPLATVVVCFLILVPSCGQQKWYIQDVPFVDVLHQAQQIGKPVWMMLGGGEKCYSCDGLIKEMTRKNFFHKYQDQFIFYKCNVNVPENRFLHHIFLMETVPNSYIMDSGGDIASFQFRVMTVAEVDKQLQAFINGVPYYPSKHSHFNSDPSELLPMQNALLKGHLLYQQDSLQQALDFLKCSAEMEICFYNLYMQGKIYAQLGQQEAADSCASLAVNYLNNGYQEAVYSTLLNELDAGYDERSIRTASVHYDSTLVQCGKVKQETKRQIEFGLVNDGDIPLVVYQVTPSCGCSKPSWTHRPIMPNERGSIIVDYEAERVGFFRHSLQVYANTSENPISLFFQGDVFK